MSPPLSAPLLVEGRRPGGHAGGTGGPVTGAVLVPDGDRLPVVLWVGAVRAEVDRDAWARSVQAASPAPQQSSDQARYTPVALLPEHSRWWFGHPGLSGRRPDGRDWSPAFAVDDVRRTGGGVVLDARDDAGGLRLTTELEGVAGGGLRARHTVTNVGDQPYAVDALEVAFPLPPVASESLDFTGHHLAERMPQRRAVTDGQWVREMRRGRTGHDAATLLVAGTAGFGFGHGEVWGLHVAWSGNSVHRLERLPDGVTTIAGGELLLPGEVELATGESYATPWVHLAASERGLDDLAAAFHGYLRALPAHPSAPRPVNLNVWEAVYFDHDHDRLRRLADLAASIGVERYVLDDGWFRHRRHDRAGLGDWYVDEGVFPDGLQPVVDHVRSLGMTFGLWFEPEMVNPDSDLFRAHPDWILGVPGREPLLQRNQLVLDLSRAEVVDYLLERLDAVLSAYDIGYVKWDHNRDLLDAGSAARGGAAVAHAQTLGYYRLLDELRRRHPDVEWETCASGGGRVDLAVLERTERVWVSDMTDALSRQTIQRWTGQLVAPEYLGAHVSAEHSHQTGRWFPLAFRAATAFFGHFGIEWDLTLADDAQRAELAAWIALYKQHRALLHSGRTVRGDHPDDALWVHGVVAPDGGSAVIALVQVGESFHRGPLPVRLPGLDPARTYRVTRIDPGPERRPVALPSDPVAGEVLTRVGLRHTPQQPYDVVLLSLVAE